ncbi:hypothetical protein AKO1_012842 [Acrasis kona]|uniref:Uncharacterized protein n=1 Tax=Acrasis kona TaxID=1008807 RepID=A0AAW2YUF4_9EUKA
MNSRISRDTQVLSPVIEEAPLVTKIVDKPVLTEVKDIKNLNVVHKDLVHEIHEQPIVEIARKPETVLVKEQPLIKTVTAPLKMEEFGVSQHVDLDFSSPVERTQVYSDAKHINLNETIKSVQTREVIERHIVPTVTEIHEQKIVNVIEQPIVRTYHEAPIVREVAYSELVDEQPIKKDFLDLKGDDIMRDSSIEREKMLPANQLSTHILTNAPEKVIPTHSTLPTQTLPKPSGVFSTLEFKNQIKNGDLVLHEARPLSSRKLPVELLAQKKLLNKSRYFSKPAFSGQFMAQKALLKPVPENLYSKELSELGQWKDNSWTATVLSSTGSFLKNAYEGAKHLASDAYDSAKHMTGDALGKKL